jgi:hypothetical protein
MYFKITKVGDEKYTKMGMVEVMAAFYLEEGDEGYDKYIAEHLVTVPVIPAEGYQGKVDETGNPIDQEDYAKWISSLPTIQQLNPFCNHSIQFEANVTEEEILWCFEFALDQTKKNYLEDDLHCEKGTTAKAVNQDIGYLSRKAFYEGVKTIPVAQQTPYIKTELAKVASAEIKALALKEIDFKTVETIAEYSVK